MPFVRGKSGNPNGKRPGTRNSATLARERFLEEQWDRLNCSLGDPNATAHSTLVQIYRSPHSTPQLKIAAASVAIRYEMPALTAQHVSGSVELNLSFAERLTSSRKRLETYAGPVIDLAPDSAREVP